ncbi:MAG: hypothetical protein IK020_10925 [Clostridiales bacterium]|nr:hypothetical protein [Clostridiales bacterium]
MKFIEEKLIPVLLCMALFICNADVLRAETDSFSLISYVENHHIGSQAEFNEVLQTYCSQYYVEPVEEEGESFQVGIDYENSLVYTAFYINTSETRSTKSGRAQKNYYSDTGERAFTISVEGVFSYSSTECHTISTTGSFTKPFASPWNSSPSLTSGNFTATSAYSKISGTATYLYQSQSYSLTLVCNQYGDISWF